MALHAGTVRHNSEFKALVARKDWHREQEHEVVERFDRQVEEWNEKTEDFDQLDIPHIWGCATMTSALGGIKITYTEGFEYDECDPDSLTTSIEGQDEIWAVEGCQVVDEDGDELDAHELADFLDYAFSSIDYSIIRIPKKIG